MKTLSVKDVSYRYGRNEILSSVTLNVTEGDILLLRGNNGSGKTTLLRLISGLVRPDKGEIHNGFTNIGYLSQLDTTGKNPSPFDVDEILRMSLKGYSLFSYRKKKEIEEMKQRFHLEAYGKRRMSELSGGEQEKVRLAALLLTDPDLLLLDEPTSGMDASTREEVTHLLLTLHEEGKTIIMVSHIEGDLPDYIKSVSIEGGCIHG